MHRTLDPESGDPHDWRPALATLKAEVDSIQVHLLGLSAPWYRQLATIIAVLSFALSLMATVGAEFRIRREELFESRAELRQLIQRMNNLPREAFELGKKYQDANDVVAVTSLNEYIMNENALLAIQAKGLIESVTNLAAPAEYFTVAAALSLFNLNEAIALLESVKPKIENTPITSGADVDNVIQLYRTLGAYNIRAAETKRGHQYFQQAMDIAKDASTPREQIRFYNTFQTEVYWLKEEAAALNCNEADRHLKEASGYIAALPALSMNPQTSIMIDQLKSAVGQCWSGQPQRTPGLALPPINIDASPLNRDPPLGIGQSPPAGLPSTTPR
jgi:hypothetical protein